MPKTYRHKKATRANNPPAGLGRKNGSSGKFLYELTPHDEPELGWFGKQEGMTFEVPTVPLHVHESIDPSSIMRKLRKGQPSQSQAVFFDESKLPIHKAMQFYQHKNKWSNRMVAGDSLVVMNSLLRKENMAGKVQTIYIDPPYGIHYRSNFQPFTDKLDMSSGDKADELTREPEQIKAFRDTWTHGIHSYLGYLRNRLLLARELLTESGSCFVQIGDENVHRVAVMMDDVFGVENRVATISYATSGSSSSRTIPNVSSYLLWYAKDKKACRYHQMYEELSREEIIKHFSIYVMVEEEDGGYRKLTSEERADPEVHLPAGARIFRRLPLVSQGFSKTGRSEPFQWDGREFITGGTAHWAVSHEGLQRLADLKRLCAEGGAKSLMWKWYESEVPGKKIHNIWRDPASAKNKTYVVETSPKIIERCILMTSDPGDLVLDPTCGSGTTAFVAEKYGRRWITCDTSRVALALAKQRLLTATYDYYTLQNPEEGVDGDLVCDSVETVSAATLAYDRPKEKTLLYDRPLIGRGMKNKRVSGPFTVEATVDALKKTAKSTVQIREEALAEKESDGRASGPQFWLEALAKSGIKTRNGRRMRFENIQSISSATISAIAEVKNGKAKRAAICFGPQYAPLDAKRVERAMNEVQNFKGRLECEMLVFAAFQFESQSIADIDQTQWPGMKFITASMNTDLETSDLKNVKDSESFHLIGQPDVKLHRHRSGPLKGKVEVEVRGFDFFNTETGEIDSGGPEKIALWMLDEDYDGRSVTPDQFFLPKADDKAGWAKLAKTLRSEVDPELAEQFRGTKSLPFTPGERIAVKITDNRGVETMRVLKV